MKIEYEATFTEVDVEWVRGRLKTVGAALVKPNFLQKRVVFNFPKGNEVKGGWARVRDEGDKVTMSVKIVDGDKITDQKEAQIVVDDFDGAVSLLTMVGCIPKAYQETRRELWTLDGVEITIDEWPFLPPFVEIEGASEEVVKAATDKLGFDWSTAKFCYVSRLYAEHYNIDPDILKNQTPRLVFNMANPFNHN